MPERNKPRIAVVSPFLDKRHGTERCVAEQVERLTRNYEVHIYSNYVEDLDLSDIVWHRVPPLPGPHLFGYIWWFAANHFQRWWDARFRGLKYDLLYTPGTNCLDADLVSVHIVFAEFHDRVRNELRLRPNPARIWPRLIHRRIYYALVEMLESMIYRREHLRLIAVSEKVASHLGRYYGNKSCLSVAYHGWDRARFGPARRSALHTQARHQLGLQENDFSLLLVGNDWKIKGFPCLLAAVEQLAIEELKILVVGNDTRSPYLASINHAGLEDRVQFLPLRKDVEFYYAAADVYVGPSLEDAFALPPLEAMACGVPVIVSRQAGVSEVITHGVDGFILEDPRDAGALASLIGDLYRDAALQRRVGEMAAKTALQFSWDRNADELRAVMETLLATRAEKIEQSPTPVRC